MKSQSDLPYLTLFHPANYRCFTVVALILQGLGDRYLMVRLLFVSENNHHLNHSVLPPPLFLLSSMPLSCPMYLSVSHGQNRESFDSNWFLEQQVLSQHPLDITNTYTHSLEYDYRT
jgi:hypothetical protein